MLAREDVQRQIAVAIVIAVKETPLLVPVQRIISGVQIQDDLARCFLVRIEEYIHPQPLDGFGLGSDLVIAAHALARMQLQAIERALAGERCAVASTLRLKLAQQSTEHRIVAQTLMVVEVFIPQRYPKHALPDQRSDRMLDQLRIARIDKAARQSIDQSDRFIRAPQQQRSGIRTDHPPVKGRHHAAPFDT
jgi:hypothetical protein